MLDAPRVFAKLYYLDHTGSYIPAPAGCPKGFDFTEVVKSGSDVTNELVEEALTSRVADQRESLLSFQVQWTVLDSLPVPASVTRH
jgi:hypothetical protein